MKNIEISTNNNIDNEKNVLVLMTPQFNAQRLIDEGKRISEEKNAQLHVLYIKKGDNIFENMDTAIILEEMYRYASMQGGILHAKSSEDIHTTMVDFIIENNIDIVILGESPILKTLTKKDVSSEIRNNLQSKGHMAEVIVVEKYEENAYKAI